MRRSLSPEKKFRADELLGDTAQAVPRRLARRADAFDLRGVIDGHRAAQNEGDQLLHERFGETVEILREQMFEGVRAIVGAAVGESAAGVHGRVGIFAGCHALRGSPLPDGVVVVGGDLSESMRWRPAAPVACVAWASPGQTTAALA